MQAIAAMRNEMDLFAERGIAHIKGVLTASDLASLDAFFPVLTGRTPGARARDFSPKAAQWLTSHFSLTMLARRIIGLPSAQLSRIQGFNKSQEANWFVPWHQDRAEDGLDRAVETLERTIALRVHLDDCNESDGPLEVLPGSHLHGRLSSDEIARLAVATPVSCLAARGEIIAMRPLLVHRSQRATTPSSRRVIHLEYSHRP